MCGIFGFYRFKPSEYNAGETSRLMSVLTLYNSVRGNDGVGFEIHSDSGQEPVRISALFPDDGNVHGPAISEIRDGIEVCLRQSGSPRCGLGAFRAAPSTEWRGPRIEDIQPLSHGRAVIVHNGTISNDKEILAPTGLTDKVDSYALAYAMDRQFTRPSDGILAKCKGSAALAAFDRQTGAIYLWTDHQPLFVYESGTALYFSSVPLSNDDVRDFRLRVHDVQPWSIVDVTDYNSVRVSPVAIQSFPRKAAVICSGGLDSTVAATIAVDDVGPANVTLLHFRYGCIAQGPEEKAVRAIAAYLGCGLEFIDIPFLSQLGGSTLTSGTEADVVDGHAGAELAHEWVPARNTVMLALAAAYCDRNDVRSVYTGFNLEEAGGGYADNSVPFHDAMNKAMQLGTKSRTRLVSPLQHASKRDIVLQGLLRLAPLHLTWSCYRRGEQHCGRCGPCTMRRVAFERCGHQDPAMPPRVEPFPLIHMAYPVTRSQIVKEIEVQREPTTVAYVSAFNSGIPA